jgi:hypothetical protein
MLNVISTFPTDAMLATTVNILRKMLNYVYNLFPNHRCEVRKKSGLFSG